MCKIRLPVVAVMLVLSVAGCKFDPGSDEGRVWIMPRPAAEIRLTVVNTAGQPVADAQIWLYRGDEKLTAADRFVAYNEETGWRTDGSGVAVIQYSGETGGGYEIPYDASLPANLSARIEAAGYLMADVDLDALLFGSEYRNGTTTLSYQGETLEVPVVEKTIFLEK